MFDVAPCREGGSCPCEDDAAQRRVGVRLIDQVYEPLHRGIGGDGVSLIGQVDGPRRDMASSLFEYRVHGAPWVSGQCVRTNHNLVY